MMEFGVEKKRGLKIDLLTPATDSERPRVEEIVLRFGQKKSEATIPTKAKRKSNQKTRRKRPKGLREFGRVE